MDGLEGGVFAFYYLWPVVLTLRFSLYLLPVDQGNGTTSTKPFFCVRCRLGVLGLGGSLFGDEA